MLLLWSLLVLLMSLAWTAPELHVVFTAFVITVLVGLAIHVAVILFFDSPYLGAIAVGVSAVFVIGWAYAIGFRPIVPF